MKWIIKEIVFFSYIILYTKPQICKSLIDKYYNENNLIQSITLEFESIKAESSNCIKQLLLSGNFKALEAYSTLLNDNNIKFKEDLRSAINNIEAQLDDIANKFSFNEEDFQKVVPSLRWAQSLNNVFIQIKFSHRLDTPGCTEVENIRTLIDDTYVSLIADCVLSDIPIRFNLNLPLINPIDKRKSSFINKLSGAYFDLIKQNAKYWPNIISVENKKEYNQIAIWYEMKDKYANELKEYEAPGDEEKSYEEIEEELKKQMLEERKKRNKKKIKKSKTKKKIKSTDL